MQSMKRLALVISIVLLAVVSIWTTGESSPKKINQWYELTVYVDSTVATNKETLQYIPGTTTSRIFELQLPTEDFSRFDFSYLVSYATVYAGGGTAPDTTKDSVRVFCLTRDNEGASWDTLYTGLVTAIKTTATSTAANWVRGRISPDSVLLDKTYWYIVANLTDSVYAKARLGAYLKFRFDMKNWAR